MFFLKFSCFSYDPTDVGNLISGSFAFSKWAQLYCSLNIVWHCPSLGLEHILTFSSPVATAEFSRFPVLELCKHLYMEYIYMYTHKYVYIYSLFGIYSYWILTQLIILAKRQVSSCFSHLTDYLFQFHIICRFD